MVEGFIFSFSSSSFTRSCVLVDKISVRILSFPDFRCNTITIGKSKYESSPGNTFSKTSMLPADPPMINALHFSIFNVFSNIFCCSVIICRIFVSIFAIIVIDGCVYSATMSYRLFYFVFWIIDIIRNVFFFTSYCWKYNYTKNSYFWNLLFHFFSLKWLIGSIIL